MDRDDVDFADAVKKAIIDKINGLDTSLVSGLMSNWDNYQSTVGQRAALVGILNFIDHLAKQHNERIN